MSSEHLEIIEKQVEILKNLEKLLKEGESVTTRSRNQEMLVYVEKNLQALKENDKLLHKLGVIEVPYFKEQWMKGAENYFQKIQNLLKHKDLDSVEQGTSDAMLSSKIAELRTVNQLLATGLDLQQKQMNEIMMKTLKNHETHKDITKIRTIMESFKKTIDEAKLESISHPHTKNIWIGKLKRWNDRLQVELSKMDPIQEESFREENYIIELEEDVKLLLSKLEEKHESIKSDPYANVLTKSPKIERPKFDGKIAEWKIFSDLFRDLFHNKNNVPDSVKLNYLRSCITGGGEARTSIASLIQGSSANYNEAWKTLVRRYEKKRINFSTQLNYLLDMPMINATSPSSVKMLHDAAKECFYIITTTIGKDKNENDEIFAHLFLRKFDKEGLQLYEQHIKKPNQIQKLEDVMDFLEQFFSNH